MLGKIAHISAAESEGPRYDPGMNDEDRRAFANLIVVCGPHHDIIDDTRRAEEFPAELLRKYKKQHEGRFKNAESQLLRQVIDYTQVAQPTYPNNLRALAAVMTDDQMADNPKEISSISEFMDRLRELPLQDREFALKLADRMRRQGRNELPPADVAGAFGLEPHELKRNMDLLEHHLLGDLLDLTDQGDWVVRLYDRRENGSPWFEILEFCY